MVLKNRTIRPPTPAMADDAEEMEATLLARWGTGDAASVLSPSDAANLTPDAPVPSPDGLDLRTKGLWHMQMGEWPAAITALEKLARADPLDHRVAALLEEARFKSGLDGNKGIRPRRWAVAWRRVVFVALMVLAILVVAALGARVLTAPRPEREAAVRERQLAQLYDEGSAFLRGRDLDAAEKSFRKLLEQDPTSQQAQEGLAAVAEARIIQQLYDRALDAQKAGDNEAALVALQEVAVRAPDYQDVAQRITAMDKVVQMDRLYAQAVADFQAGRDVQALEGYEQLRSIKTDYRPEEIAASLHTLYMRLGQRAVETAVAQPEEIAQAREYFTKALSFKPSDRVAARAQRLATGLDSAVDLLAQGRWEEVIPRLRALSEDDTTPISDAVARMLYDAYLKSGEQQEKGGDVTAAIEAYRLAADLPLADTSLARERLAALDPTESVTPNAALQVVQLSPATSTPEATRTISRPLKSTNRVSSTHTPRATATPWQEEFRRTISLDGPARAFKDIKGNYTLGGFAVQCLGADSTPLTDKQGIPLLVPLHGEEGTYVLPEGTKRVVLWVDKTVYGEWWDSFDVQAVDVTMREVIVLRVVERSAGPSAAPSETTLPDRR